MTRPLVSSSGAVIVTVLRPVLFPKYVSSNYTATQTLHTYFVVDELIFTGFVCLFSDRHVQKVNNGYWRSYHGLIYLSKKNTFQADKIEHTNVFQKTTIITVWY